MDGRNIIGSEYVEAADSSFRALNPHTGLPLEGEFYPANSNDVDAALKLADAAFKTYKNLHKDKKAAFLRAIGEEIVATGDVLIQRACEETGLPAARIIGERGRTVTQLNMFADLIEEGSWVEAIFDPALPERQPTPRPDLRRMLVPAGPVAVFGASNFPLAFSVAGGDTASALAAGCPVVVKAHSAHPGTSSIVASAIVKAAQKTGMPQGIFSILFDSAYHVGEALVKHPLTKSVAFTGSFKGGMALNRLASARRVPIPVFAEMSSINPVILLPEALEKRAEQIAAEYAASITLGAGQFCTNPGLLLGIRSEALESFKSGLSKLIEGAVSATMLTPGICDNYCSLSDKILSQKDIKLLAQSKIINTEAQNQAAAMLAEVPASVFVESEIFREEVFGPWSLLVVADDINQLEEVLEAAGGQLTVSLISGEKGVKGYESLVNKATDIAGRLLMNGVPTGVEVCHAMQHGGPFPSTTDSRFTSVGATAIRRFVRPVCYQGWQADMLPDELKDGNPFNIWRLNDKKWTKE